MQIGHDPRNDRSRSPEYALSKAEVRVSCTDGTSLVIGDNLQNYSDGTTGESSLSQLTPAAASAADQLGTIKKNVWF